jgi:BRCT domain type II-containing protein
MWKKPQDTRVDNTMDSISDTQDAAHLLLTAASALTSLTRQSSSPPTVDTRGGSFFIGERSLERQQPRWAMKDVVVSTKKSSREKAIKFPVKVEHILLFIVSFYSL